LALRLHSSSEPGELSQWLCHDDSTIDIVEVIIRLPAEYSIGYITKTQRIN